MAELLVSDQKLEVVVETAYDFSPDLDQFVDPGETTATFRADRPQTRYEAAIAAALNEEGTVNIKDVDQPEATIRTWELKSL